MPSYANLVELHRSKIKQLIHSSGVECTIRLAAPKVTTNTNPLFGDFSRETSQAGETKGPFKCLYHDAFTARSVSRAGTEAIKNTSIGQYQDATSFLEIWLEDVLENPYDISGITWFDRADSVIIRNNRFDVLGSAKHGLSVADPYILLVALKGGIGIND